MALVLPNLKSKPERIKLFSSNSITTYRNIKISSIQQNEIHNVWHPNKNYQAYKGKLMIKINNSQEEKLMIEINLELTYTLKFTEKDIKTIIIAVFKMMFMFKKTVSRNMDNIKKIQTEFQKMKTSMSEMKNIIDTMNRLDTSEQNINELKT